MQASVPPHDEGGERCFPASILSLKKKQVFDIFLPDSQRSPLHWLDPGSKHDAHDNGICSIQKLSRIQPQPAFYFFQAQPIHWQLHKNILKKKGNLRYFCDLKDWFQTLSLQMKNIMQSGQLPEYSEYSSSSVLIPSWQLQNLVSELCQMTDLRCRTGFCPMLIQYAIGPISNAP